MKKIEVYFSHRKANKKAFQNVVQHLEIVKISDFFSCDSISAMKHGFHFMEGSLNFSTLCIPVGRRNKEGKEHPVPLWTFPRGGTILLTYR